ncbi:hypothetical protein CRG98_035941 [Punica granatum]|uniref:Uncharacterized protein n=1 Tax=Punica granatum TaxID=22663 RepID=A0A2I0IJZ4_PUNGR|nr:hypothetical protein CRG98_035941 [Punica granatum]
MWLDELAVQESKQTRVSKPDKVASGTSNVARRTCGAGKKVNSHGLADPARLQEARARWLGELAVQEMKLARVSRPGKVARGTSEVARRTCGARNETRSDLARLQEARARWLGELAVQEMKLARVSRPGKVARGTNGVARQTCGAEKKVISHGIANPARLQEARARWLGELAVQESCKRHERGGSANLRCKKVNSNGLADPARLQEARTRWLGELAEHESKLARVSRPGKVARSTGEVARRTCVAGKNVSSHRLADLARLQAARVRWLGELAVQESELAQGCKRHEQGGSAHLRCKKWNSLGLADLARLQEARARWLGELAVQEMKLARVSRPGKVARGTSEVARRTCGARNETRSG